MLLPSSKYLTNRDLILAVLSKWTSTLSGIFESEDTGYLIDALRTLWYTIDIDGNKATIEGGIFHMKGKNQEVYVWNHGTITRYLAWLALVNTVWTITLVEEEGTDPGNGWNETKEKRSFQSIVDTLQKLGIWVESANGQLPITITPTKKRLKKEIVIDWTTDSLFLLWLLQVAPCLQYGLIITVEWELMNKSYIDLTIHEMNKFHVSLVNQDYKRFIIQPQTYHPQDLTIEWDASAISYPVAYKILHGWTMTIDNLWTSTKQWEYWFLKIAELFWLKHKSDNKTTTFIAPWIEHVDLSDYDSLTLHVPDMPWASMTLMILSLFLPGKTTLTWLEALNQKKNKRVEVMAEWIQALGVEVSTTDSSITIGEINTEQVKKHSSVKTITINSYADHRIAMAFWVLDNYLWNVLEISDPASVGKTYPTFWEELQDTTIT